MQELNPFSILEKYRIKSIPYKLIKNKTELKKAGKELGYPLALKIISRKFTHKKDIGGIRLGIGNEKRLLTSYEDMLEDIGKKNIDAFLVQKMARKGIELIIGGKKDAQFGHMIILGMGGTYVEIFKDFSARICPITEEDVDEMVNELRSHPILQGARGEKPISMKKLTSLMLKICKLLQKERMEELDLNPVIINHKGYDIVDMRYKI